MVIEGGFQRFVPMSEYTPPESVKEAESLQNLDARLRAAIARREPPKTAGALGGTGTGNSPGSGVGLALRIGVELVSAVFLGVVVGLFLDKWLETGPLFLVLFLFLGAAAGFLNVYRTVTGIGLAVGYKPPPEKSNDDEEEDEG